MPNNFTFWDSIILQFPMEPMIVSCLVPHTKVWHLSEFHVIIAKPISNFDISESKLKLHAYSVVSSA